MRLGIYITVLSAIGLIASCRTAVPQKTWAAQSESESGLSDYTLFILIRDMGSGAFEDIFDRVQKITGNWNLIQQDWSGSYDGPTKIEIRLHALTEKAVGMISHRLYSVSNVISVTIERN